MQSIGRSPANESTPGLVMQPHRLAQVIWVTVAASATSMTFVIIEGWWGFIANLLGTTLGLFLLCIWLLKRQKPQLAIPLFVFSLTMLACGLIYQAGGIHDEAVTLFPAILIFVCMFGTRRQYFILLFFIIVFLGFTVGAELLGWHPAREMKTDYSAFIHVSVILITTGSFAFILSSDLRNALTELNRSKQELLELNEGLEVRVAERTAQYETANHSLQESLAKLERAHNELVHAEKLASLGSMVAGISHELNTPIGNALLTSTSLETSIEEIMQKSNSSNLSRTAFNDFLAATLEMSTLISRSNRRAAELITSFKQVAVDQSSEQRRIFNLKEVVDDNLSTLLPTFTTNQVIVNNTIPAHIECDSFPGPLGQILTNLVQNAILHGIGEHTAGTITIQADLQSNCVTVCVQDSGTGIAPGVITHIFDPFFTTKLGKGGSGLGLSISHRIATSVLGGNLTADSPPGSGAVFRLTFPAVAPFPL